MKLKHTKDSLKLTEFAMKYPDQWHSYSKDARTTKAVERAKFLNEIETNDCDQFKFKPLYRSI